MIDIRRLGPADALAYRTLMLEAYGRHPDAFTSTVAERAAMPIAWWQARVSDAPDAPELVIGAVDAGRVVGAAGISFEQRARARHKATLFGMYVPPELRGRGLGRRIVDAALAQVRGRAGVRIVQLTVTEGNAAARALYESCGFVAFGIEPYAVALDGGFVSKVHMWRDLASTSG